MIFTNVNVPLRISHFTPPYTDELWQSVIFRIVASSQGRGTNDVVISIHLVMARAKEEQLGAII